MSIFFNNDVLATFIAGVDEAGRGPLAGPVIAAAVILNPDKPISGLNDSKLLSEKKRIELSLIIKADATAWAIGRAEVEEIDKINILQASLLAMQRAVAQLVPVPEFALIDGNRCPNLICSSRAVVQGDKLIPAISAASILAKVARDEEMIGYDKVYPQHEFAVHKGYPTPRHLALLELYGITPIHRRSFAPVKRWIQNKFVEV